MTVEGTDAKMATRLKGSFIIPCFREEKTVYRTIVALDALAARKSDIDWEIIVIDDGSDDDTASEAKRGANDVRTPVRLLQHRHNSGLGAGMKTGFSASTGDIVVAVDCDLSYSVEDVGRLIDTWLVSHPHVVIASPYMKGGQALEVPHALEVRSKMANEFLSLTSYHDIKTLTGMVRAYDGPFIRAMSLKAEGADIMVEILYKAQVLRASIVEIPATLSWSGIQERASRSSITSTTSRLTTYRQLINGYLWRPFWVPLIPAVLFGILALVLTIMGRLGLTGLTIVSGVLSMQLFVSALMSLQNKRYFEELFNLGFGLRMVSRVEPPRAPSLEIVDPGKARPLRETA